jgi:hypothetical protein
MVWSLTEPKIGPADHGSPGIDELRLQTRSRDREPLARRRPGGGRLMFRGLTPVPAMYRGLVLHPDDEHDPYVFRIDLGLTTSRVVFSGEPGTGTTAAHLDLMPLSLHKQPATMNPRRWATGALGALGALAVGSTARAVRRRSRPSKGEAK